MKIAASAASCCFVFLTSVLSPFQCAQAAGDRGSRLTLLDDRSIDSAALAPEETQLRSDYIERQRVRDAALSHCAAGAVIGAGLTALWKNNTGDKKVKTKDVLLGGLGGCAAGAAIGAARGHYVHARTQQYAEAQEAELQMIAGLENDISDYQQMNETAARLVTSQQQRISRLNAEYARSAISTEQYRAELAGAQGNLKALRGSIDDVDANIETLNRDIAQLRVEGRNPNSFEAQRQRLVVQRSELQSKLHSLRTIYASVPASVQPPLG